MGFLDRIFGGKKDDDQPRHQFSEPMDETTYWAIVSRSISIEDDQDEQTENLKNALSTDKVGELAAFQLRTDELMNRSYTPELWCAAYLINGGSSDDGFEYFRGWLISRGKPVFESALANPDTLANETSEGVDEYEYEEFLSIAASLYREEKGLELFEFIDQEGFQAKYGSRKEIEMNWDEEDPETMRAICPKLFDRMEEE